MYVPTPYEAPDTGHALDLIREYPFGILTIAVEGRLQSVHAPFILREFNGEIYLQAHIARANDISRYLTGQELLVHFSGPHSYVSPAWYSHTHHYPTWIYSAVHCYGFARIMDDDELPMQLEALINMHESKINRGRQWQISTMPEVLTEKLKTMIIGFEIKVSHLEPCFKLNQHKNEADMEMLANALNKIERNTSKELAFQMQKHFVLGDKENIERYLKKYDTN